MCDVDDMGENLISPVSTSTHTTLQIPSDQQNAQISSGIKILSRLPDQATCEELMARYTIKAIEYAFHKPTVLYCMQSLWATFGQSLRHPRKSGKLRSIVTLLNRNTSTDFPDAIDGKLGYVHCQA